ncbi:hypothetical protein F4779DRAFT_593095 [Xylariaceae sp. FL0662B]|nr:hypothetical protein F4779DRAFT_593095 [Xylariaceae sp. FL0662B]
MSTPFLSFLFASAAITTACELPSDAPLNNNITQGFAIQLQNASYPDVHNHMMNLWESGGGDQHLYLSPAGNATSALTLVDGVITFDEPPLIRAVINGEYSPEDNTTKMFMTERGDPRAYYDVVYGCNPDTDAVQTELAFKARDVLEGGHICVRSASGDRYEFRYSPPNNTAWTPERPCIQVTLAVVNSS